VAWTLTLEVLFYTSVPLLALALHRAGKVVTAERLAGLVLATWLASIAFTVGASHISIADASTYTMQVYSDGALVQTYPVSMGTPENATRSGPHVVIDKERNKIMDSTTYGLALDAGGYLTEVEYATRISNNGEFVHAAPWSVAQQGNSNVSHGCINLAPERAAWFFDFSQIGDVVEVINGGPMLGPVDGDIYDWAIPWETWLQGSALN